MFHDRLVGHTVRRRTTGGRPRFDPDSLRSGPSACANAPATCCARCAVSAQLLAYIENGRWLAMAAHATAQPRACGGRDPAWGASLEYPTEANEVFVR
jgi:hypothetical protein